MSEANVRLEKAANLLRLAVELAGSAEGWSLEGIERYFSVNRRTAERMRDAVRDLFPSFETLTDGRHRRFRIQGGLSSFLTAPSVSELAELETAVRSLEQTGHGARAVLLRTLRAKISASLREGMRRRMAPDMEALCRAEAIARQVGPHAATDASTLELLREALIAMKRVRFSYPLPDRPEGYVRTVVPYGLLFGRNAYLVGREAGRQDAVLWRLDRMDDLRMTGQRGLPPAAFDLDAYAARSFGTYQEEPVRVVLRFAPSAAEAAARTMFHPSQETRMLEDGRLEVRFTAGGQLEMVHHLFGWGGSVDIVEPVALRERMIAELKAALAKHEGRTSFAANG
ncbi:MAG: WYL domain-containing protein [Pseudomonadota bacterium]